MLVSAGEHCPVWGLPGNPAVQGADQTARDQGLALQVWEFGVQAGHLSELHSAEKWYCLCQP